MSSQSSLNDVSNAIRQEIIRFESVHPNIYAIYDLIDAIDDKNLADSLRQLVVSIEDAFVNSQEWTLSNSVSGIKLGLLGSVQSGKSALVHRYLTGAYVHDESPEGGRFKKELSLDNQSHLLLIRDEGGPPDLQFSQWVDGVIFVFSLENIESYQVVYDYYARLSAYRSTTSLPIILVGTQDSHCEPYVRVIDDARARKLANDLKRCAYYETCAAYGLNVDRVFQDACLKILQLRASNISPVPRPVTPQLASNSQQRACANSPVECLPIVGISQSQQSLFSNAVNPREGCVLAKNSDSGLHQTLVHYAKPNLSITKHSLTLDFRPSERDNFFADVKPIRANIVSTDPAEDWATHPFLFDERCQHPLFRCPEYLPTEYSESIFQTHSHIYSEYSGKVSHPPSTSSSIVNSENGVSVSQSLSAPPISTVGHSPFIVSSNFPSDTLAAASSVSSIGLGVEVVECKADNNESLTPSSTPTHSRKNRRKSNLFQKRNDEEREREKKLNGIGSGRAIPLKQGFLYKRTCKPLSKEWKTKKYVTLTDDARLTYHPSIHDYMDNTHGKEIDLSRTTVKIPGVAFRQVGSRITSNGLLRNQLNEAGSDRRSTGIDVKNSAENSAPPNENPGSGGKDSSSVKKRHRRIKSNPKGNNADGSDSEGYEFQLISMDRQWHFEASGPDERDEWVMHIERAIMTRLQLNESSKRTRAIATGCLAGIGGPNHLTNISGLVSGGNSRHGAADSNSLNSSRCGAGDANELAVTEHLIQNIRSAAGNDFCADCGAPEPDWASLNLGAMVCISCSGIHRQLGTHISRIRSLHLDEWSTESVAVMVAIGNTLANSVWEAAVPVNAGNRRKPDPSSSREEKEIWIRAKYERQEFLPPLPYPDAPLQQQLIDAIARQDTRQVILCLALATPETVNAAYSRQDPRAAMHIAATLGNLVYLQLLLWYNGDPTVTDHEGRNAFYYAHCSQKYDCADFLLRNGCPKQLVPPIPSSTNNVAPTLRSTQNMSQQQIVQSHSIVHGSLIGSTGLSSGVADMSVSNSMNSGLIQPHHFSHLQQHQSSTTGVTSHLSGQLPSYHHHPMTSGSITVNQQLSSQGLNHPLVSVSGNMYTGNVNHALGATLPRRRAPVGPFPPGVAPPSLQPFPRPNIQQQQQQMPVSNTHRPTSSVIPSVTRPITPNAMLRTSSISSSSQPPHTRSASNTSGNTATTLAQPYISTTQEVGL
ncbi:Arf-GAP with GTPase, ANK repeat and PH domain-containing protein 3 [Schistosoma japonicum]|nr:Arf-GAP with GTPase, ANK repeat and PH domain-containing protein 3 [Schistosoma japonicum]